MVVPRILRIGVLGTTALLAARCNAPPNRHEELQAEKLVRAEREIQRLRSENDLLRVQRAAALRGAGRIDKPTLPGVARILANDGYHCRIDRQGPNAVLLASHEKRLDMVVSVEEDVCLRLVVVLPGKIRSQPKALAAVNAANRDLAFMKFWVQDEFAGVAAEYTIPIANGLDAEQLRQAAATLSEAVAQAYQEFLQPVLEPILTTTRAKPDS